MAIRLGCARFDDVPVFILPPVGEGQQKVLHQINRARDQQSHKYQWNRQPVQTGSGSLDGKHFVALGQRSEIDQNRQQYRYGHDPIENLRQEEREVRNHGDVRNVILNDIRKQFEKRDDNEERRKDDQNKQKVKTKPAQYVTIQNADQLRQ